MCVPCFNLAVTHCASSTSPEHTVCLRRTLCVYETFVLYWFCITTVGYNYIAPYAGLYNTVRKLRELDWYVCIEQ